MKLLLGRKDHGILVLYKLENRKFSSTTLGKLLLGGEKTIVYWHCLNLRIYFYYSREVYKESPMSNNLKTNILGFNYPS